MTDFDRYRVDPTQELHVDFFVPEDSVAPAEPFAFGLRQGTVAIPTPIGAAQTMIVVHQFEPSKGEDAETAPLGERTLGAGEAIPPDSVWIDLFEPTSEERKTAEDFAGVSLPTPEEMDEIEPSELLYTEDGGRYMTARVL